MTRSLSLLICLTCFCCKQDLEKYEDRSELAKSFFQAAYSGNLEKVDSLIADSMVSSYPIFQQLLQEPTIRGRKAYISFQKGFNERWKDTRVSFHETIAEGNTVCLLWSFSGTWANVDTTINVPFELGEEYSWGGLTLVSFNESGKIIREVGEESSPGPFIRLSEKLDE